MIEGDEPEIEDEELGTLVRVTIIARHLRIDRNRISMQCKLGCVPARKMWSLRYGRHIWYADENATTAYNGLTMQEKQRLGRERCQTTEDHLDTETKPSP